MRRRAEIHKPGRVTKIVNDVEVREELDYRARERSDVRETSHLELPHGRDGAKAPTPRRGRLGCDCWFRMT
jgi:hypothetical protein